MRVTFDTNDPGDVAMVAKVMAFIEALQDTEPEAPPEPEAKESPTMVLEDTPEVSADPARDAEDAFKAQVSEILAEAKKITVPGELANFVSEARQRVAPRAMPESALTQLRDMHRGITKKKEK